ncbi:cytochrome-c peroxidase [Marinospirillum insulare]|uniref:Methylamine utilization protein MauG n=1 Tax=Marinospirillum insulare TaxID=217169 RepID=A0ABQ5ZXN6_9GAMM|nr:cytochrome c peroxidase [Marinospirillum insulare]GLR62705.1 methylamine utilization protein MauG [Marinospirillum insulare]
MSKQLKASLGLVLFGFLLAGCDSNSNPSSHSKEKGSTQDDAFLLPSEAVSSKQTLGFYLFNDPNLSLNRSQSCASCHNAKQAFIDTRPNSAKGAVSLGDDGVSLGQRNAPALTYAYLTPSFNLTSGAEVEGGFFHDGRAASLQAQAGQPLLNPVEMNMPSKEAVILRLQEKSFYTQSFKQVFGDEVFATTEQAYNALTSSLASWQSEESFASFDSKYDRWLAGSYQLTPAEERGKDIFYTPSLSSCINCHTLDRNLTAPEEMFTNYLYKNVGAPVNLLVQDLTGITAKDAGLDKGAFKTPSLRNVAVTGPYMHNGVFAELDTVLEFYNFRSRPNNSSNLINPETDKPWGTTSFPEHIHFAELMMPALSKQDKQDLIEFLKALTDQRYEHLIR